MTHTARKKNLIVRLSAIAGFFCFVCLLYVIRLGVIQFSAASNGDGSDKSKGYYTREETITALRGEIFDRNGTKLVSNEYKYDIIIDYGKFPAERGKCNDAINSLIYALNECGKLGNVVSTVCPFSGVYPDITYAESVTDPDSTLHSKLLRYTERNMLKTPEGSDIPSCDKLLGYMLEKYDLAVKTRNSDGEIIYKTNYPDSEITNLLRIYYDMEIVDFGYYVNFTFAEDVGFDAVTYILEKAIPGADMKIRTERAYNFPGYASHILGKVGPIYAEDWDYYKKLGYDMGATVGISGCEYAFEKYLRGIDGKREITEDKDGNIISQEIIEEPIAGMDVYLTIDIDLQISAEDGLAANADWIMKSGFSTKCESGAIVAIDPDSFEILAIASYPTYDLSTFSEDYETLAKNPALPLFNRALEGTYAPGSTFKIGMAAMGLTEEVSLDGNGYFNEKTLLHCTGTYTYYESYQPDCWIYNSTTSSTHQHGWINVSTALRESCNCFFYDLGRMLGIETMNRYGNIFGLGQPTGIELHENTGILAGPEYRVSNNLGDWQPTDTIVAAIGQSDNAFSPLQIAAYVSTVLNGGTRRASHLLLRAQKFDGSQVVAPVGEELASFELSEKNLSIITSAMRDMIKNNSTCSAFMAGVPVDVGGKSGTAQTGKSTDNGLFVCAAPYDHPEIVVTAVLERGAGGSYLSKSCSDVLKKYYKLKDQHVIPEG